MGYDRRTPPAGDAVNKREASAPQVVLVVDDNEDVRDLWRACLTYAGFHVTEAVDGADAVTKALQSPPDVIVIDFSMPVMNGADAIQALKQHAATATTPVIGVTAHGRDAITKEFRQVCDTVLVKPVTPETLLNVLRRALRRESPPFWQAST